MILNNGAKSWNTHHFMLQWSMVFYKYFGKLGIKVIEEFKTENYSSPNEFNDPFELTPRSKFTIYGMMIWSIELKQNQIHFRGVFEDMKKDGYPHTFERFIAELPT